jgi:hypothetical protein
MPVARARLVMLMALLAAVAAVVASSALAQSPGAVRFPANCRHERVRPRAIVVTCADANFRIGRIAWAAWTAHGARGRGTAHVNDCTTTCVQGRFHSYRGVTVRLSHPVTCTTTGVRQFTRLRYVFTRGRPSGLPKAGTQLYRCVPQGG